RRSGAAGGPVHRAGHARGVCGPAAGCACARCPACWSAQGGAGRKRRGACPGAARPAVRLMSKKVLVEHGRLLDVLGVEVELLVDASSGARPDARVPAVPGLTLAETVRHVGSVYRMVVAWLRTGERP